jgi:hypothetical protein
VYRLITWHTTVTPHNYVNRNEFSQTFLRFLQPLLKGAGMVGNTRTTRLKQWHAFSVKLIGWMKIKNRSWSASFCRFNSKLSIKVTVKLSCMYTMQGERSYSSYSFLNSTLDGENGQRHAPAALYQRERTTGILWIGGWKTYGPIICFKYRGYIKHFTLLPT